MSVVTRADQAQIHWLVDDAPDGVLLESHALLYVPKNPIKLGQVTRDTAQGLTPQKTFQMRYDGSKSLANDDIEATDLFVIHKHKGQDFMYDDEIRQLIHHLHKQGKCDFDALHKSYQLDKHNSEALVGYDREKHLESLTNIIKQYCGVSHTYDTRNPITWRWKQQEDCEMILDRLEQHELCLFAAYTSRGKTKISMEVAHQLLSHGGVVLVTTPITDTKKSFWENCVNYHFGDNRNLKTVYMDSDAFAKTTVDELRRRADHQQELIFVVLTVQDLRWGEALDDQVDNSVVELRSKYSQLSGNVDLWIRDERHSQYNGFVTSKRLSNMKATWELDLTATPYNCYDKYDWEQVVSRTLLWGLKHKQHTRLPTIRIDAIGTASMTVVPELNSLYSQQEGYDPRKLFLRHNNNFVMEQEIVKLADGFYNNPRSRNKNPISIVNDTELSGSAKRCGLWVMPNGQEGDSANDYLPALAQLLNRRGVQNGVYYIDSYSVERQCPNNLTIGEFMQHLIDTHGRVVILTCGKFLTGTDIPSLGHVVLFDRMDSVANFEQLLGRMIREYPEKHEVKLYAMAPGASVAVTLGRMAKLNAQLGGGTEYEILDCIPLSEYTGTAFNKLTVEEILELTQAWFKREMADKLPINSLLFKITNTNLEHWNDLDVGKFKKMLPKIKITEENLSKIRKKLGVNTQTGQPRDRNEVNLIEKIGEIIQSVIFEAQWVAYSINSVELQTILSHEAITLMFGEEVMDAVITTIFSNKDLQNMIDEHIRDKQFVYRSLSPELVYPELFGNSKLKQSIGLVYVPFELAEEIVGALP